MTVRTCFTCEDVKFSTNERRTSPSGAFECIDWSSAKVSVCNLGFENSWLMVEEHRSGDPSMPVIFKAMREGWKISCDEDNKIVTMHTEEDGTPTMGNQNLRFDKTTDFWLLVYQISLCRLREYVQQPAAEPEANDHEDQDEMDSEYMLQQAAGVDMSIGQAEMAY